MWKSDQCGDALCVWWNQCSKKASKFYAFNVKSKMFVDFFCSNESKEKKHANRNEFLFPLHIHKNGCSLD